MQVHPRLSVNCICSYHQSLPDDVAMWTDLGIDHVALILPKIEQVGWAGAGALVKDARLSVSTIFGPTFRPLDAAPAAGTGAADRALTIETLEFAASIGAASVYICSGAAPSLTWDEAANAFCELIGPAASVARDLDVPLLLEPTNPLRSDVSFVYWQRDAMDIARAAGVQVMLDLQSCWYERGLDNLVCKNLGVVGLVQLSDYVIGTAETGNRVVPGDGDIPLERLVAMVLDAGYRGSFDIEVMGPRIESEGYPAAVRRSVERASELLERLGA